MMQSLKNILLKAGQVRWVIVSILWIVILLIGIGIGVQSLLTPAIKRVQHVVDSKSALKNSSKLHSELASAQAYLSNVYTVLVGDSTGGITRSEAEITRMFYEISQRSGCPMNKVQVTDKRQQAGRIEYDISLEGQGSYRSIGHMMEKLENLKAAVRFKEFSLAAQQKDLGNFYGQCVVVVPK